VLQMKPQPILAVCSSRREDSCPQAKRFTDKVLSLGGRAQVLKKDMTHKEINDKLGWDDDYTRMVDTFLSTLDEKVSSLLN